MSEAQLDAAHTGQAVWDASDQRWRCAVCGALLHADGECDCPEPEEMVGL